jgi:hypothetical protein
MLSIFSSILGFMTSGLPSVLGFFQQKSDQKHELAMAQMQMDQALAMAEKGYTAQQQVEEIKLDEVNAETYAQERIALYEYASKETEGASQWVINLRASVRPIITYIMVGILLFIDVTSLIWAIHTSGFDKDALVSVFSTDQMAIVASIIGFWFGSRHWGK